MMQSIVATIYERCKMTIAKVNIGDKCWHLDHDIVHHGLNGGLERPIKGYSSHLIRTSFYVVTFNTHYTIKFSNKSPNHTFLSQAHIDRHLKVKNYKVVIEKDFNFLNMKGYKLLEYMLEERRWIKLNNLIQEKKKSISLEFHANAFNKELHSYKSYVQGKYIDYSPDTINDLLDLCPLVLC